MTARRDEDLARSRPAFGPLRRGVVAVAVLLLGAVAASRLSTGRSEDAAHPAVALRLTLPAPRDVDEIARRWAIPLEAAARSTGAAELVSGSVDGSGLSLVVSLRAGADAERVAARIAATLAGLRRELPDGAALAAWPLGSRRERSVVAALSGPDAEAEGRGVAESLRTLPGVRDVRVWGVAERELRLVLAEGDAALGRRVEAAMLEARRAASLGSLETASGGRALPVASVPGAPPAWAPVALGGEPVRIDALGTILEQRRSPESVTLLDGRRVVLLTAIAAHDSPMTSVDAGVRALLDDRVAGSEGRLRAQVIESDGLALRRLFVRLAFGLLGAATLAALAGLARAGAEGALRLGASVPIGAAAALNAAWMLGLPLDETTAPALALGVVLALPLGAARLDGSVRSGAAVLLAALAGLPVPVALHLAGGRLAPDWADSGEAFAAALGASALTTLLVAPASRCRRRTRVAWRALRVPLRDPATALLGVATLAYVAMATCGRAFDPRDPGGALATAPAVAIDLGFADGTPLSRTTQALAAVQGWLAKQDVVETSWGVAQRSGASCYARLRPSWRSAQGVAELLPALRHQVRLAGAVPDVRLARGAQGPGLLAGDERSHAATDAAAGSYRVVLRGGDPEALLAATARISEVASRLKLQWDARPRVTRVEVAPRAAADAPDGERLAAMLRPDAPSGRAWPAPEPTVLVASWPGAQDPDAPAPQRADLLERPRRDGDRIFVPSTGATARERAVAPALRREDGRFVVPIDFRFPWFSADRREEARGRLDTSLSVLRLPAGCELERPSLSGLQWPPERLRLLAVALGVPVALWGIAALVLDALLPGALALTASLLGATAGAVALRLLGASLDARSFVLVAAALCASFGVPLAMLARSRNPAGGAWAAARAARAALPPCVAALLGLGALAAACRGLDSAEDPWSGALLAAVAAAMGTTAGALVVAPASALVLADLRRRWGRDGERLRRPPPWRPARESGAEPGPPSLALRHVTKEYRGGVRALHDVSLELRPGIIGLLGPNGAGKTTLLRCLTGLLRPTRGEILYRGVVVAPENLAEYRMHLGFLPQEFNAYPGLTARQFLEYWALERGMRDPRARRDEIERLLAEADLLDDAGRKVRDFSGGMRQRLGIARALLGSPPVLVVDEPTTGLDVESRTRFRRMLLAVAGERLVILSTHVASDVESAAGRLLLIHRGTIRFDGAPSALVERARGRVVECVVPDADLREFSRRYRVTARVRVLAGIRVRAVIPEVSALPGALVRPSLEEAYLAEIDAAAGGRATG